MSAKAYSLTSEEKIRLTHGVNAVMSIPVIDSLEDFIWEGVFCYAKDVELVDPMYTVRSKALFDVVDVNNKIGWSAKTISIRLNAFAPKAQIVIQRADIMKKRRELGFPNLTLESPPAQIGAALIKHWQLKVEADKEAQGVTDARICILIKGVGHRQYAYLEEELRVYDTAEIDWAWANSDKKSMQGTHKETGRLVYSWYKSGTQFFESFYFDKTLYRFDVNLKRLPFGEVIGRLS